MGPEQDIENRNVSRHIKNALSPQNSIDQRNPNKSAIRINRSHFFDLLPCRIPLHENLSQDDTDQKCHKRDKQGLQQPVKQPGFKVHLIRLKNQKR